MVSHFLAVYKPRFESILYICGIYCWVVELSLETFR